MAKGKQLCLSFLGEILTHWYKNQIQYIRGNNGVFLYKSEYQIL
jgi:hypothetical protein